MEILRRRWHVRYPGYLLGPGIGLVMPWLPDKTFHDQAARVQRRR
ncbi:hypothetical protein [Actinoplanes xinjiangensis]